MLNVEQAGFLRRSDEAWELHLPTLNVIGALRPEATTPSRDSWRAMKPCSSST